jgi:hypothetical protein
MWRHRLAPLLLAALTALSLPGCMLASQTPAAKLREQVQSMNEEARWSRMDLAQERATPKYQPAFVAKRAAWGKKVSIGDLEIVQMVMAEDGKSAESIVSMSWYNLSDMTLRSSTVKQSWKAVGLAFSLDNETVIDGDTTLFAKIKTTASKPAATKGAVAKGKPVEAASDAETASAVAPPAPATTPAPEQAANQATSDAAEVEWEAP